PFSSTPVYFVSRRENLHRGNTELAFRRETRASKSNSCRNPRNPLPIKRWLLLIHHAIRSYRRPSRTRSWPKLKMSSRPKRPQRPRSIHHIQRQIEEAIGRL